MKKNSSRLLPRLSFAICLFPLINCVSSNFQNPVTNAVDYRYRHSLIGKARASTGISFYQKILAQTLYSTCRWLPSDSSFAQTLTEKCGPLRATPLAMARFFNEPNAQFLGHKIILTKGQVHFENLPHTCALF